MVSASEDSPSPEAGLGLSGESRESSRKSLFAAATICFAQARASVRIRNISRRGALIECPNPPDAGTELRLMRGSLSALGRIRWTEGNKAGLAFEGQIDVTNWLASCAFRGHQERVDEIVSAIRRDSDLAAGGPGPADPALVMNAQQLIESLLLIQRQIQHAAEAMALDPAVLTQHGAELQSLDGSVRTIRDLINRV
jgi:hypothetical protein